MWSKNKNISIVVSSGSWYEKYLSDLVLLFQTNGFLVDIYSRHDDVPPDNIVFYLSYNRIVSTDWLSKNYRSLVIHASDLPKGKGFSPWVWQIIAGENTIVISLIHIVAELDSGPIVDQSLLKLNGDELLPEIRDLLAIEKKKLMTKYLLSEVEPIAIEQKGESSFYRKRNIQDSQLDVNKTIEEQFNLLRVVDNENYPAFFLRDGQKYILSIRKE